MDNYKERYEQALAKAKEYYDVDTDNTMQVHARGVMELIFPELAESEDEKIMKGLIAAVETLSDSPLKTKILAWLEKQGEQKLADNIESSLFRDKLLELFQRFRWYCKDETLTNGDVIEYVDAHIQELIDTTQKPTEWSEEDESIYQLLKCSIYD